MVTVLVKRWTREDYEMMIDAGIFAPSERLELIDEEVVEMSPRKSPHSTYPNGESGSEPPPTRSSTNYSGGT